MSIRVRTKGARRRASGDTLVRSLASTKKRAGAGAVLVDWNRHMHVVGPLTDDETIAGYDTDWTHGYVTFYSQDAWKVSIDRRVPDFYYFPGFTLDGHWHRQMRPIRFAISTDPDLTADGGTFHDRLLFLARAISESAVPSFGTAVLNNPIFGPPPTSEYGPPGEGHFAGSKVSSLSLSIPFGSFIPSPTESSIAKAKFARVMIDGVDATGVISVSSPLTSNMASLSYYNASPVIVSIPETDVTSKTIEVDLWIDIELDELVSEFYDPETTNPHVFALNGTRGGVYGNVAAHYLFFVRGLDAININARRAVTRNYRLTFSDEIADGITEVVSRTSADWTLTRTNESVLWSFPDSRSVELIYGQEIVELIIRQSELRGGHIYSYRYFPAGTGHYVSYSGAEPGIFTPAESQTFVLVGYIVSDVTYFTTSDQSPWAPFTVIVEPD